jgi:hypothetical protein
MFHPKIALHWASPALFIPFFLHGAANTGILPYSLYDTVYLDRNGQKINSVPSADTVTYLVKTTQSTDELYGPITPKVHQTKRGNSHPILSTEADATENLIKIGMFKEARESGNLVLLRPLIERKADGELMLWDRGSGGKKKRNNREYATAIYKDKCKVQFLGKVSKPYSDNTDIFIPCWDSVIVCTHSHPSGEGVLNDTTWNYGQGPSNDDIEAVHPGQICIVFGRKSDTVYIYDSRGVIAALPTKSYMSL